MQDFHFDYITLNFGCIYIEKILEKEYRALSLAFFCLHTKKYWNKSKTLSQVFILLGMKCYQIVFKI